MSWLSWLEMGYFLGSEKVKPFKYPEEAAKLGYPVDSSRKPQEDWIISKCKDNKTHFKIPDTKMSCFSFLKVMMVLFNLAIALGGATLLGIGIWVSVDNNSFVGIFGALSSTVLQFVNVGYLLIAIGSILFFLGFLGCCGAQKESKCLLIMFFSIILIIVIVEVAAAVVALVYTSLAETILKSTVTPNLKQEYAKNTDITTVWNTTMSSLKCCGLTNYTDFDDSYYLKTFGSYPPTCCINSNSTKPAAQGGCDSSLAHESNVEGCFSRLLSEIRKHSTVVGGVAAGIAALEIAAMAVAMYLYCRLDEK